MGRATTTGYKTKMDCLEKEYTLTCKDENTKVIWVHSNRHGAVTIACIF